MSMSSKSVMKLDMSIIQEEEKEEPIENMAFEEQVFDGARQNLDHNFAFENINAIMDPNNLLVEENMMKPKVFYEK